MVQTDLLRRGIPWLRLLLETGENSRTLNLGVRHRLSTLSALLIAVGVAARRPYVLAAGAVPFIALNQPFYALLLRRRGLRDAVAGVGLHAIHHLTAAAAVPIALVQHAASRRSRLSRVSARRSKTVLRS
jgi:hypothetical protein